MEGTQAVKKQKTDETTAEPMLAMSMTAPAGSIADTSGRTSETPVSIPPTITYGLQDTHTTILPCCFYFSIINLDVTTPTTMCLRLNTFNNIIDTGSAEIKNSINANTSRQVINYKAIDTTYSAAVLSGNMATTLTPYPWIFAENGDPEVWYRQYFTEMYSYYTVLGCEYEITYFNPRSGGRHNLVAYTIETTGTTDSTRLPTDASLQDLQAFKQVRYENVGSRDNSTIVPYTIIKGTYKPGTAKRDVSNDGDVKLWTQTAGNATPSYKEVLQLMHYVAPLSSASSETPTISGHNLQVQVRMKYIVQFKQLKQGIKYPAATATTVTQSNFPTAANPFIN
jgi:hypothetical protein